eukprot:TRINITY_DN1689_c0_g1_i7.p1 TRINITY_DN1689_c0_g1~~TRINITY_DN1689_c0_g1_i7.p1  ORF type:complete len:204 (-),score=52.20 TRINITY_DN1689_c0_g1_i7:36-647(-)
MVGDSGVGKSSFLLRYTDDVWYNTYISTIGVDFKIKTVVVNDLIVKLQIWDTAGPERFRTITSSYYRGAHGHLVFYDATSIDSFKRLPEWLLQIERYSLSDCCKILIGTKTDDDEHKQVNFEEAKTFADQNGLEVCETSAKTGANVEETILKLVEMCVKVYLKKAEEGTLTTGYGSGSRSTNSNTTTTNNNNNNNNNNKCIVS